MLQVAVFVDAGYLFAQGSALIAGAKAPRSQVRLNAPVVIGELGHLARTIEPSARLLRIYWYDGLSRGAEVSFDQKAISESENVKCRFGTINSRGEQKGVDSLIVTDLIELARTGAISEALVVSGDEDIRVGVQVGQTFGIRVHLLGIQPSKGSQSPDLRAEADTLHEWSNAQVATWLDVISPQKMEDIGSVDQDWLGASLKATIDQLSPNEARRLVEFAELNGNTLPQDFDRPALARAGDYAGRRLDNDERKTFRDLMREALRNHAMSEQKN